MNSDAMCNTPVAKASSNASDLEVLPEVLPENYVLQPYDILSGRGRTTFNSIGNRRFRVTLTLILKQYKAAKQRKEKTMLIKSIVETIRANGGRFLNRKHGRLEEIGDKAAREKVAHALRDMINGSRKLARKQQEGDKRTQSTAPPSAEPLECGSMVAGHFQHHSDISSETIDSGSGANNGTYEAKECGEEDFDEFDHLISALAFSGCEGGDDSPMSCNSYE
jgi:hypothetical protein